MSLNRRAFLKALVSAPVVASAPLALLTRHGAVARVPVAAVATYPPSTYPYLNYGLSFDVTEDMLRTNDTDEFKRRVDQMAHAARRVWEKNALTELDTAHMRLTMRAK